MKRTGKFYRKNERDIMKQIGLKPTYNSGSGWVEKEDGENEHVLCQLKSTDANSIKINLIDINKLEANAITAHKIPLFAIQFIQSGDIYLMAKPSDLHELVSFIDTGCTFNHDEFSFDNNIEHQVKKISSSQRSRDKFWDNKKKEGEKYGTKSKFKTNR